jgi:hypothetical protein
MVDFFRFGFGRRQEQQHRRFYDKPSRERHYVSIIGSVLSIVVLVVALALREWAKAGDDTCNFTFGLTKVYITHNNPAATPEVLNSELQLGSLIITLTMRHAVIGSNNSKH